MAKHLVVTLIVLSLLLNGCQWIEHSPETIDQAQHDGMVFGCINTVVYLAGPPPSEEAYLSMLVVCDELATEWQKDLQSDADPPLLPTPTIIPGSIL